jgi:hypothetical protein
MSTIRNITPHAITVDNGVTKVTYEPDGLVARVTTESTVVGEVDGFEVVSNTVKGDNLPEVKEGVYLLVSAMVLGLRPDRKDLIAPNTGAATRNDKGHIVSVPGFVRA